MTKEKFNKEKFDSPVTKEMRKLAGMNDNGTYANKDYDARSTKLQAWIKNDIKTTPISRKYVNEYGKHLNHQARANLYRESIGHSNNPLVQQHGKDKISRLNNQLAKEKLKLHSMNSYWEHSVNKEEGHANGTEAVNTMAMATGKPNLGADPISHATSGNNVNSDIFKNKWDNKEW